MFDITPMLNQSFQTFGTAVNAKPDFAVSSKAKKIYYDGGGKSGERRGERDALEFLKKQTGESDYAVLRYWLDAILDK